MRFAVMLVALLLVPASVSADPPASPRLAALASKRVTESAFWNQAAADGTPFVEDVKDPKGRLLVTFVYRSKAGMKHVAVYGAPGTNGYARLERVPGTKVFAWSTLVDPRARFTYILAPGDNFGPPDGSGDFAKRLALFRPDPLNKRLYMEFSSLVELPKAPRQLGIVPKPDTPSGEVVSHKVKSKALGNERTIHIYTPPGFSKTGPAFPLVVMFDGLPVMTYLALPIVLDESIAAKRIPPVVVLAVGNADREKELPADAAFADFVALDLVPWVRKAYNATSDPRRTVIAGVSLGALAATFAAGRHPAVYGNVLSQSGSFWWSPEGAVEAEAHAHDYATSRPRPLRFWMEVGTLEAGSSPNPTTHQLGANRHMRDVLLAKGYDVTYREFVGAHEFINWRGTIGDGLAALLARPPKLRKAPPSPGKPGGIGVSPALPSIVHKVQRIGVLDGGAKTLTMLKQLPQAASVTEEEVNDAALALLHERATAAVSLLEWNVQRFPKSWNAHDSLGLAYYHAGERSKAIASYKRSVALNPKNEGGKRMLKILRE